MSEGQCLEPRDLGRPSDATGAAAAGQSGPVGASGGQWGPVGASGGQWETLARLTRVSRAHGGEQKDACPTGETVPEARALITDRLLVTRGGRRVSCQDDGSHLQVFYVQHARCDASRNISLQAVCQIHFIRTHTI